MDGGSTDDTVDILSRTQSPWPKTFRWVSQPDGGQAMAINSGFCAANGSILGWLNSDDVLLPNTISLVAKYFSTHPDHFMVYGDAIWINASGTFVGQYPTCPPEEAQALRDRCFLCQPAVFFRSCVIREIGLLDPNLVTAMDYDYWIRAFKSFPTRIGYMPLCLALSRLHDNCKTVSQRKLVYLESMAVVSRHFSDLPVSWFFSYIEEYLKQIQCNLKQFCNKRDFLRFFKKAMNYYGQEKRTVIKNKLRKDRRLALNSDLLKIDITDDGWTGERCNIIIRRLDQMNSLRLDIIHERPIDAPLNLIISCFGIFLAKFTFPKNGRYSLTIPLTVECTIKKPIILELFCDSTFIPSRESQNSSDCRSLGIEITDIKLKYEENAFTHGRDRCAMF